MSPGTASPTPTRATQPRIADLVEVAAGETVVRLDGRAGRLAELVLTGDVTGALASVLRASGAGCGGAFFLVGHFGSGKSHLLAALTELLAHPGQTLPGQWGSLSSDVAGLAPALTVAVPLVEHRAGAVLEDLVLEQAWAALPQPATARPETGTNRRAAWEAVLTEARTRGCRRLFIALDELSEFLRAKQGPALVEDLRFLQFLGEWAMGQPVVVVAALQESIEEVANVSQRELTRIRDRYRTLPLSMRHVEDLVRGRLLRLRPGAEALMEQAHRSLQVSFPGWDVSLERFARCYPVHPATLSLLEGLRFLFSQQRGVVDFLCRQMLGDASLGVEPWQDRGYLELLTPDRIFDHFRSRLAERTETRRLAESVVPYWERAVEEAFGELRDRTLALRATKLLCLLWASPLERPRTAPELAHLLLVRVSAVDPGANTTYFEDRVLKPLSARGAYVVDRPGPSPTYTIELEANAAETAALRLAQARAELTPGDRRIVRTLIEGGHTPTLPLPVLASTGTSRREVLWQNTLRRVLLVYARLPELAPEDARAFVEQARAAGAEGAVIVGEPEVGEVALAAQAQALAAVSDRILVWAPNPLGAADAEAAMELHARRMVLQKAIDDGETGPGSIVEFLGKSSSGDSVRAEELLRSSYFGGVVAHGGGTSIDLPSLAGLTFDRLLKALAGVLLLALHPQHGQVAPRGELVGERLVRQIVHEVVPQGRLTAAVVERQQLRLLLAGYLEPLGVARKKGDAWVIAPDPARSPAVSEALRLAAGGAAATAVVEGLADGPLGLTGEEAVLLLNGCVASGLLELTRGRRTLVEPFLTVGAGDRLATGELVEAPVRSSLAALGAVTGVGAADMDSWSTAAQREAWEKSRAWMDARREDVAAVRRGLEQLAEDPALAEVETAPLRADLRTVTAALDALSPSLSPVAGLTAVATLVGEAPSLLGAARRLGTVARFFREALGAIQQSLAYVLHPDLVVPAGDEDLVGQRSAALRAVPGLLALAAEDRISELTGALQEFRRRYVASYRSAHDRYYASAPGDPGGQVRQSPAYRALAAFSRIRAISAPDDLIAVNRALSAGQRPACTRRVDVELAWKPRCPCGFVPGAEPPPPVDAAALIAQAERGVTQHLAELARDSHRARLEGAVGDLVGLGREELAADLRALLGLVAAPGAADRIALASLLEGGLAQVLEEVLRGGQLVVRRDLGALREALAGRRFPKRRLLELLAGWVDPSGDLPPGGFVEVTDASAPPEPMGAPALSGATAQFVASRFPQLAALLPEDRPGEAFWLAAWWAGEPRQEDPPAWLPAGLLEAGPALEVAAEAAVREPGPLADLRVLDAKIGPESLLGDQVAAALALEAASAGAVAAALAGERLLRHPLRLASEELARRLGGDWQLAQRLGDLDPGAVGTAHALAGEGALEGLGLLLEAAEHLAELERRLPEATCQLLVEELYPAHYAPVAGLLGRAELASVGGGLLSADSLASVASSARRLLARADEAFAHHAAAGAPGCLPIWEVGRAVVQPLLAAHGRVAVLLVDAMRADVFSMLRPDLTAALADRLVRQRWAVVPAPTRTVESVTALYLGRPVPGGDGPRSPDELGLPFAHLGYESSALVAVEQDHSADTLRNFWAGGPAISVAVATGVDKMLHRSSVELVGLVAEAVAGLRRRVLPTLTALPAGVPLVVLADHGFRENPNWGRGNRTRWGHGGTSLEECVVPVAVLAPAGGKA